jgi:RNA polymerase sigma-70 factor, ECF subfamily
MEVVGAAAEDASAFESPRRDFTALVRNHQSMVYSLALRILRDASAAEELAQEVFLQLHRRLSILSTDAHVLHWLRKVTCHRAIDRLRRSRSHPEIGFDSVPEPSTPCYQEDPMLLDRIRKLVASLPESLRTVVVLRYQEELEPTEIAELLNQPVRRVKANLHQGLALLREKASRLMGEIES